jgi:hypothetical protein
MEQMWHLVLVSWNSHKVRIDRKTHEISLYHYCCEVRYLSLCDLTWSLGQSRMRCVSASAAWVYTQQRLQVCSLMSMERIELYEQHYSWYKTNELHEEYLKNRWRMNNTNEEQRRVTTQRSCHLWARYGPEPTWTNSGHRRRLVRHTICMK